MYALPTVFLWSWAWTSFSYFILQSESCISLGIKQFLNLKKIMVERKNIWLLSPRKCLLPFPFIPQHLLNELTMSFMRQCLGPKGKHADTLPQTFVRHCPSAERQLGLPAGWPCCEAGWGGGGNQPTQVVPCSSAPNTWSPGQHPYLPACERAASLTPPHTFWIRLCLWRDPCGVGTHTP